MFDGSIDNNMMNPKARMTLRESYRSRLSDGTQVPRGMKIQGIDVIDPTSSRISHQVGLSPEIDGLLERGASPCIVIFVPIMGKGVSLSKKFSKHGGDPCNYAVVDIADALRLLGNSNENQGLRNSVNRRMSLQRR